MTTRFAGSRSLDERRRRRLASESDETLDTLADSDATAQHSEGDESAQSARQRRASQFPLRKLVSQRLWKLWGVGLVGLLVGGGILALGWHSTIRGETLGPGLVRMLHPHSSRLPEIFNAALLLMTAQLSLLIWWVRSRSMQDFDGRYRSWAWNAVATLLLAFIVISNAHVAWSETALWLWSVEFWNIETLCWLVPVGMCAAAMLRMLHCEMRRSRSSLTLLWLSVLCVAVAVDMRLSKLLPLETAYSDLTATGVVMLGHLCYFLSVLFHVRYVVYVSFDPPVRRARRIRLPRFRLPRLRRNTSGRRRENRRKESSGGTGKPAESVTPGDTVAADDVSSKTGSRSMKRRRQREKSTSNSAAREQTGSLHQPAAEGMSVDEPHDREALKGLSKRERRKLRKQWREQQRAARMSTS